MTLSFSLPGSTDTLSFSGLENENGRKSALSGVADGFAELLNNLASINPPDSNSVGRDQAADPERQGAELPSGKLLPVAVAGLPGAVDEPSGSPASKNEAAAGSKIATVIPFAPLVAAAAPMLVESTGAVATAKPQNTENASTPAAMPALGTRLLEAFRAVSAPATSASSANGLEASASGEPKAEGIQVRISAATQPQEAKIAGAMPSLESGKARLDLPAAAPGVGLRTSLASLTGPADNPGASQPIALSGGKAAASAEGATPAQAATAQAAPAPAASAQAANAQLAATTPQAVSAAGRAGIALASAQPRAGADPDLKPATKRLAPSDPVSSKPETATTLPGIATERLAVTGRHSAQPADAPLAAAASDRKPSEDIAAADKPVLAPRAAVALDTGKAMPQPVAAPIDGAAAAPRPPLTTASQPVVNDPFADVERVVEHLMAARQVDLTKPAAIAIAHREFGALTVTFDQSAAGGMNVEIAAENSESQRALAAAMANDRGTTRQQDTSAQPAQAQNQSTPSGSERGGAANQGGSSLGHGTSDGQRSHHSDPRGRHGERAEKQRQAPEQGPPDNHLYA
ncbi:MAG: hypothetical protein AB3N06_03160 [Erythrobacter sp.]